MARTRNTVSKAAHLLRSGRQVDIASSVDTATVSRNNNSGEKKKKAQGAKKAEKTAPKSHVPSPGSIEVHDLDGAADDDIDEADEDSSEESDVEDSEQEDSDTDYPAQVAQKDTTQTAHSIAGEAAKGGACVTCRNAQVECVASAVPGQPCQRCAKMRLRCVVVQKHESGGAADQDNNSGQAQKTTAQESDDSTQEDS